MSLPSLTPPADRPVASARIPAWAIRAVLTAVGVLLTLIVYRTNHWLALGLLFSALAGLAPRSLLGWGLIAYLAIGELDRPTGLTWQLLVLIAGVHLIHVLSMLALALPPRGLLQPRALLRPLRRFVATELPVQALAVAELALLAPNAHGHRPLAASSVAIVGAPAVAGLTLLALRRRAEDGAQPSDRD